MGLQLTATESAKLTVEGTSQELSSAYARLNGTMSLDGSSINANIFFYEQKANYTAGEKHITLKDLDRKKKVELDVAAGEQQTIATLHDKLKAHFEGLGYTVQVVDLA